MLKLNKLLPYALDFISFLLERVDSSLVEKIILFGSVARDEADDNSDIDLFVETIKDINLESIKKKFFESTKFTNYWKLKGMTHDIKIVSGKLSKWKELQNSIISNGIMLYGKYEETPKDAVHKTLFSWENTKSESQRVMLFKKIFGYSSGKKKYPGLLEKYNGEKISKGSIIVPTKHYLVFEKIFRKMKMNVKIRKIIEYS